MARRPGELGKIIYILDVKKIARFWRDFFSKQSNKHEFEQIRQ